MQASEVINIISRIQSGEIISPLPAEVVNLAPMSSLAISIYDLTDLNFITSLSEAIKNGKFLELGATNVALLHTFANRERQNNNKNNAILMFERILLHTPQDHNVRIALFEYYFNDDAFFNATAIIEPILNLLKSNPEIYNVTLKQYILSAFNCKEYEKSLDVIKTIGSSFIDNELRKIIDRIDIILKIYPAKLKKSIIGNDEFFDNCLHSMSESEMINNLNICLVNFDFQNWSKKYFNALLAIYATCEEFNWFRSRLIVLEILINYAKIHYNIIDNLQSKQNSNYSKDIVQILLKSVETSNKVNSTENIDFKDQLISNWTRSLTNNKFKLLASVAASDLYKICDINSDLKIISNLIELFKTPVSKLDNSKLSPIWYFITWQNNNEQLSRLLHGLISKVNNYVVSIGGANLPRDINDTSSLLNINNLYFIFNPVVTWGGQKLLFQNMFEAINSFEKFAPANSWFQCICNRSYPLMSGSEAGAMLFDGDYFKQFNQIEPPYCWHKEWPDEVVKDLPNIFTKSINSVFTEGNTNKLRELAYDDTRYISSVFNFSDKFGVLEPAFKDSSHNYNVSPFEVDIRWMSFARLIEFVDVASETTNTFTRRLNPITLKWVHKVMAKHNMRIGDPFITFNKKYADIVINNDDAIELYAAMNHGFGPEMNYFDTIKMSSQYDVKYEMGHAYYRNLEYVAGNKYITEAEKEAENDGKFFVRKTIPEGGDFIKYFADKNAIAIAENNNAFSYYEELDTPLSDVFLTFKEIWPQINNTDFIIRDLNGVMRYKAKFDQSGIIVSSDGIRLGNWSFIDDSIRIFYEVDGLGEKFYKLFMANSEVIILPPDELVSYRNSWSAFLEFSIKDVFAYDNTDILFENTVIEYNKPIEWNIATTKDISMLSCFEKNDFNEYPSSNIKALGCVINSKLIGGRNLYQIEIDNIISIFELVRVVKTHDRLVRTFIPSDAGFIFEWDNAKNETFDIKFIGFVTDCRANIYTIDNVIEAIFSPDNSINSIDGLKIGTWAIYNNSLLIFGIENISYGKISQLLWEEGKFRLSGWGKKNLKDIVSFRICLL